jgi:choline dehydrogenase-like flavoprotein
MGFEQPGSFAKANSCYGDSNSLFDVIIIGSGAAGTFSAYALKGLKVLVLDVGHKPTGDPLAGNLYDLKDKERFFHQIVGPRFESLHEIENPKLTPKAKAPLMRYVIQEPQGSPKVLSEEFYPTLSYAEGGLANIWGAQVYRFNDEDLKGFPISADALSPFYDTLVKHIGISGSEDDLSRFLGGTSGMLPALKPAKIGAELLARYHRKAPFFHRNGVYVGLPRLAVLSREFGGRKECNFDNLEFLQSRNSAIYSPAFTLCELVNNRQVEYLPGRLVERYEENESGVAVTAKNIGNNSVEHFRGKKLILCLGAFNTARLVLFSKQDFSSRLPVVENPFSLIPMISWTRIGMPIDKESYSSQLCFIYSGNLSEELIIGMIYGIEGIPRSDLLFDFPLAVSGCLAGARYILPAMAVMQVYHPLDPHNSNYLKIDPDGSMIIKFNRTEYRAVERHLLKVFRRVGYLSAPSLIQTSEPGHSNHYAGPLPMKAEPGQPYETDRNGLLFGSRNVYIGDSATFPRLPSKNLTFTIMANALRIGHTIRTTIEQSL